MRSKVLLIHISSIGCCNPLVTMLNNGNFGFPYSLLPRFPPLQSGAAFSTPAFSVAPFHLRLPKSVTLNDLENGVMAVSLRYSTEFDSLGANYVKVVVRNRNVVQRIQF